MTIFVVVIDVAFIDGRGIVVHRDVVVVVFAAMILILTVVVVVIVAAIAVTVHQKIGF